MAHRPLSDDDAPADFVDTVRNEDLPHVDDTAPWRIDIPERLLALEVNAPWPAPRPGAAGALPGAVPYAESVVVDAAGLAALERAERDRRVAVAEAAFAATAALQVAAAAAQLSLIALPADAPIEDRLLVTRPVSAPVQLRERPRSIVGTEWLPGDDLQLPHPVERAGITADAMRRTLRVLRAHAGARGEELLLHVNRAVETLAELHAWLVAHAGPGVDERLLARDLREVAAA